MESDGNRSNRLERRKEETRKKIIGAAKALFDKQGFMDTTMEQIAETADVAKKTLYNHFPAKEAILAEFVQRATKSVSQALINELRLMSDTRSRLIHLSTELLGMSAGQEDVFKAYFAYRMYNKFQLPEDQSIRSGGHNFAEEIIKLGQQTGELRNDLPVEAFSNHLEMVFAGIVTDKIRGKDGPALRKSIEENVDIFLDGVRDRGK